MNFSTKGNWMTTKRLLSIAVSFILLASQNAFAGSRTGFEFLRTQVGARPAALGGAFLAITGDVHSVYYNPAALTTLGSKQLSFSYLNHFLDFQSGFFAYSFERPGIGRLGVAGHYTSYGEFDRTDEFGNESGTFGAGSFLIMADYATKLSHNLSVGFSLKFIRSSIAELSSSPVAGDVGLLYEVQSQQLAFGVGIFNVGSVTSAFMSTKDDLPINLRAGITKKLEHLPLQILLEGYRYGDEDPEFVVGGEFTLTPFLFLRLSYNSIGEDQKIGQNADRFAGVSIGTGITLDKSKAFSDMFWQNINVDFSLTSSGEVGSQSRFSIGVTF